MSLDDKSDSAHRAVKEINTESFVQRIVPMMKWDRSDVLMDIGCGSGEALILLLPMIPEIESIIGIDILSSMVESAKTDNPHPRISYFEADITDQSTLIDWRGRVTKVISMYCFNCLIDMETGFRHLFDLLHENGEAVLIFVIKSKLWDCMHAIIEVPKWMPLKELAFTIPESTSEVNGSQYFRKIFEEIGFLVHVCKEEEQSYPIGSDADARESVSSRCPILEVINDEVIEDFKDDIFELHTRLAGRDETGKAQIQFSSLFVHLQKPSIVSSGKNSLRN